MPACSKTRAFSNEKKGVAGDISRLRVNYPVSIEFFWKMKSLVVTKFYERRQTLSSINYTARAHFISMLYFVNELEHWHVQVVL